METRVPTYELYSATKKGRTQRTGCTNGDGGKESLWYVGDDDTDEEDDGVQPIVAEDECDDEEGDPEEDSHACN